MKIAGIDACPVGWIAILHHAEKFSFEAVQTIDELMDLHPDLQRLFIDIPIGLSSSKFTRTIESKLRKELGNRASTVFTPACRRAIYASNYDEAKTINKNILGKSISIQSYNISKNIREIDEFTQIKAHSVEVYESHPELCFKYLNASKVISSKKSTQEGFQERFDLLQKHYPQLKSVYQDIRARYPKSNVKPDDILDAMVLCVSNLKSMSSGLRFFEDDNKVDDQGVFVKVAY